MAGGTLHILMAALEWKDGALVIEERGLPLGAVVALRAPRDSSRLGKLRGMRVLMAIFAVRGNRFERNMEHGLLHVRWPMAACARHGAMRAGQEEARGRMIESCKVLPFLGGVAGFTAERSPGRAHLAHAYGELAAMRVGVASGTGQSVEVKSGSLPRPHRLVAVDAWYGQVASGKHELRLLVPRKSKG